VPGLAVGYPYYHSGSLAEEVEAVKREETQMKLYYSHSITKLGMPQEQAEIEHIRTLTGAEVYNPLADRRDGESVSEAVARSAGEMRRRDGVVVTLLDGFMGRGVYGEVCEAMGCGIPVWWLSDGVLTELRGRPMLVDENDWKLRYATIRLVRVSAQEAIDSAIRWDFREGTGRIGQERIASITLPLVRGKVAAEWRWVKGGWYWDRPMRILCEEFGAIWLKVS